MEKLSPDINTIFLKKIIIIMAGEQIKIEKLTFIRFKDNQTQMDDFHRPDTYTISILFTQATNSINKMGIFQGAKEHLYYLSHKNPKAAQQGLIFFFLELILSL